MKKIFVLLIISMLISCNSVKYTHFGNINSRLNFKKGKWLLNDAQGLIDVKTGLTKIAKEGFTEFLGNRLLTLNNSKGILIPGNIPNKLSKPILKDIKKGSSVDYFITINGTVLSDEVDVL